MEGSSVSRKVIENHGHHRPQCDGSQKEDRAKDGDKVIGKRRKD
jgi:hypothetical protein